MALDIDHFKAINDQYGHDVGDEVIKAVAARLKSNIRDLDTVSRLGGDEFVIVVKDQQSEHALIQIAVKLLDIFNTPLLINDREILVHISIGLTLFDPDTEVTLKQLLKQADMALYQAKHRGRNTYMLWK
jgi:diguanylate cyclase (GGDEF)-like protein